LCNGFSILVVIAFSIGYLNRTFPAKNLKICCDAGSFLTTKI
jgi:hypothetical protein